MIGFWNDFKGAIRSLKAAPFFAFTATLTLALGVGVNVSMFSVLNGILLKPLPVRSPEEVVRVNAFPDQRPLRVSYSDYEAFRDRNGTLNGLTFYAPRRLRMESDGFNAVALDVEMVSTNHFEVLGVPARIGRTLQAIDDGASPVGSLVVSNRTWQNRFGLDPDIIGQRVQINGAAFQIVGVLTDDFRGLTWPYNAEAWVAWNSIGEDGTASAQGNMAGRLDSGRTLSEARADLRRIAVQFQSERTAEEGSRSTTYVVDVEVARRIPTFFADAGLGGVLAYGLALAFFVGLTLLVVCTNVGSLVLGRWEGRRRELGIRVALGASRRRILRFLLVESLSITALACTVAIFLAWGASRFLATLRVPGVEIPLFSLVDLGFDRRIAAFTVLAGVAATLIFGLLPATAISKDPARAVFSELQAAARRRSRLRGAFVALTFAVSGVLITTTATFAYTEWLRASLQRGFDTENVYTIGFNFTGQTTAPAESRVPVRSVLTQLNASPTITASTVRTFPFASVQDTATIRTNDGGQEMDVWAIEASPRYLDTLGISVLAGRDFTSTDYAAAIVNETLAEQLWPGENPVGMSFELVVPERTPNPPVRGVPPGMGNPDDSSLLLNRGGSVDIVGLAANSNYALFDARPTPYFYVPLDLDSFNGPFMPQILAKIQAGPSDAGSLVRRATDGLVPNSLPPSVAPLETLFGIMNLPTRIITVLSAVLGVIALVVAGAGTFGVVAYRLAQRKFEIGVCMAVGATQSQAIWRVASPTMLLSAGGILAGCFVGSASLAALSQAVPLLGLSWEMVALASVSCVAALVVIAAGAGVTAVRTAIGADPMLLLKTD